MPPESTPAVRVRPMPTTTDVRPSLSAHPTVAVAAPAWTIGRLSIVVAFFLTVAAALLFHNFDVVSAAAQEGIFLAPALVFTVVLFFLARPWVYLTAGILVSVLPLLVLFVFGGILGLAQPAHGNESLSLYLLLPALLLALPAGILGFAKGRKNRFQPLVRGGWRSNQGVYTVAIAALFVGVLVASAFASEAAREAVASGGYDFAAAARVTFATQDFVFAPNSVSVGRGVITELEVENRDAALHTFTYEKGGTEYSHDLLGGATSRFLVRFDDAGAVKFWCNPHSDGAADTGEGMVGTLTVT